MSTAYPPAPPAAQSIGGGQYIGNCWRCSETDIPLFQDPMLPMSDRIGVCLECAQARYIIWATYRALGTNLHVNKRAG